MFTRDSKKLQLVVAVLMMVGLIYAVLQFGLNRMAEWAETETRSFPYLAGEDPIRYLLPTMMTQPAGDRMLLIGASETGENMLYERFQAAFTDQFVYTGGISTGTFDDILVVLDYLEEAYGEEAMPGTLVVGITVRVISNMPRRFGPDKASHPFSPLFNSINQYSRYFSVVPDTYGSILRPKSWAQGQESLVRFLVTKQQPRYRAALAAWLDSVLEKSGWDQASIDRLEFLQDIWSPLNWHDVPIVVPFVREVGLIPSLRLWLSVYRSPYQTQYMQPANPKALEDDLRRQAFWREVYTWEPLRDADMVRKQMDDLRAIVNKYGIELYVVNMPENPVSRQFYAPENYAAYMGLVKNSLNGLPFLDLNTLLSADEFVDETHATLQGAERVTAEIIDFIERERKRRVARFQ